jgi:hypothetical protein
MRVCYPIWHIFLLLLTCAVARGGETFPYRVTVAKDGIEVRSGPGRGFYVTDRLPAESSVQVYRHAEGGWLGIRPPQGSFSWVRREQLQDTGQPTVARVLDDDVACRVGSSVVDVLEHVGQVHLERDELVRLLPPGEISTASARQLEQQGWCRIAPPAGEFRWIHADDLPSVRLQEAVPGAEAGPVRMAAVLEPDGPPTIPHGSDSGIGPPRQRDAPAAEAIRVRDDSVSLYPPRDADDVASTAPDAAAEGLLPLPPETGSQPGDPANDAARWVPRGRISTSELLDVEQRLALMASREVATWRLQPLRNRVEALLPRFNEPGQREHAQRLLARIAEFEGVQNRYAEAGEGGLLNERSGNTASGAVPPPSAQESLFSRFDGSGWLVPVHSTRRVAPPYALLDAEGEVLQYISPAPGLNLHRYVRKQVGIHGQRSQSPSLNKPHLTAERIVELSRHLR